VEIGKIIKENRTAKNMTQEDLANEFFVSRPLISKWENGRSYPDLEQLIKLSDFFDLTLDELMRGDKKMTKKLNLTIKRKPIFIGIIILLFITIISIGYFLWSEHPIQLKPSDIEIISVKTEKNPSIDKVNVDTGEKVTLPEDFSYTIKYKIKRPFTAEMTGYYFDNDQNNIYVDMRGRNSLFPSNDDRTFIISSDAKLYGENDNMEINKNYTQTIIKDKDIKILDINSLDPSISISNMFKSDRSKLDSDIKSWLLIKKSDLKE